MDPQISSVLFGKKVSNGVESSAEQVGYLFKEDSAAGGAFLPNRTDDIYGSTT